MSNADQTEALFEAKYAKEQDAIERLGAIDRDRLGKGAAENLKLLKAIGAEGLAKALRRRERFPSRQDEIRELAREFILYGAKAALLTGAQRGGDFLNNQLRGQWAERVVLSMRLEQLHFTAFGPSGAAMPGEEDHREVIMTFKAIQLLEGKRPDLLAFDKTVWDALGEAERSLVATWPKRRLETVDEAIVKQARCGIEVKNSLWHYQTRRAAGGGPLSITVKQEEVPEIRAWMNRTGLPLLFVQVLFDEMYCMSFGRIDAVIQKGQEGFVHESGDHELDESGDKPTHKFRIGPPRHLCGKVAFPTESTAEIRILNDGSVVPYVNWQPAKATNVVAQVILDEIGFDGPVMPPSTPPNPSL